MRVFSSFLKLQSPFFHTILVDTYILRYFKLQIKIYNITIILPLISYMIDNKNINASIFFIFEATKPIFHTILLDTYILRYYKLQIKI